jgi:hypothetical protein
VIATTVEEIVDAHRHVEPVLFDVALHPYPLYFQFEPTWGGYVPPRQPIDK